MALQCLKQPWARSLAGVFCLSSFLASSSQMYEPVVAGSASVPRVLPVYLAHGSRDDLIPVAWARETAQRLTSARTDCRVQYTEYADLGHDMHQTELQSLMKWMEDSLSAQSTSSDSAAAHSSIQYTISQQGESCRVVFSDIPAAARDSLLTHPLAARGSYFQLEAGDEPTTAICSFVSPAPQSTAQALSERIAARLQDPAPPGADACSVS